MISNNQYIEREAVLERLKQECSPVVFAYLADLVNAIPAADVRPVVKARWETVMLDHERMGCRPTAHYCSECHQITWFRTFFCPNCGADMREEGHA